MNLISKINGITVGIRYQRSFRIPDIAGDIVDDILHDLESPFTEKLFTAVQETANRERTLFNNVTNEYLRINTDDLILGIKVTENFPKKFGWIKKDVLGYFQEILFKRYKIKNIQRTGIIFHHKIERKKSLEHIVSTLSTGEITKEVDNISISFGKKLPAKEALYRKNVEDYKNTIYNLLEFKKHLYADFDFQYYYNPELPDLRMGFTEKICDDALDYLKNHFHPWVSTYATED